jgi:dTDP-4-amino-4,6-dideoxygalactose transaminase
MFPGGLRIDIAEEQAVLEVLRSKRLFRYYGPGDAPSKVAALESRFAEVTGTDYALGMNSCTSALHVALLAVGVQPGDEVLIPAYTFVATGAAVVAANAIPVLVEVDQSFTMDPADAATKITGKTKAIIPVHMRGAPAAMDRIMKLARTHDLAVVEDAAQANGGSFRGTMLGAIGHAGCFSFQFHKIITAGEGGMLVTNGRSLVNRAKAIHDTGANWRRDQSISDPEVYPEFPGFNYRMPELLAAVVLVQLEKRKAILEQMRQHAARLRGVVSELAGTTPRALHDPDGDTGICVMFTVDSPQGARQAVDALTAEGIEAATMGDPHVPDWHVYSHWDHIMNRRGNNDVGFPFTLSDRTYSKDMCPKTLDLLGRVVHMNVSPEYSDTDIDEVALGLRNVFGG